MKRNQSGFTLVEVLLSVAIIAVIGGISAPVFLYMQQKNDLDITVTTAAHVLRRAQILSQASDGDSAWGIHTQNGSIILFKGTSYATRDQNLDEVYEINSAISVSGLNEVVYQKMTGIPQSIGSISFNSQNESRSVSINSKGTVSY